jgi:hypothetical protein
MKKLSLFLIMIFPAVVINYSSVRAADRIAVTINPPSLQANMGDKITYRGTITNNSDQAVNNLIVYISLANVTQGKESPMDLEDWSANKAIKVDTLPPRGTYEGQWPMRLIDSGSYAAYITVVDKNNNSPVSSPMSHLKIKRVLRLNPNNVLPVAVGEPVVLGAVFMFITFRRKKGTAKF